MRRAAGLVLAVAALAAAARAQDAAAPAPVAPAAAPDAPFAVTLPDTLAGVPGTWDLSREGTNRRCTLTLTAAGGEAGRRLYFPAGCRRALPITAGLAGWLFADGTVRLVDRNVRPVLLFTRRPDRRSLVGKAENEEIYSLVPLEIAAMRPAEPQAEAKVEPKVEPKAQPETGPTTDPGAGPPAPAAAPDPGRTPAAAPATAGTGTYALERYRGEEACRLDLAAGGAVRVLDGCRDSGLLVFDPVTWRFADGRLTLKARRGHSVSLAPSGEGRWRRDPETGIAFVLHRVEP